MNLPVKRVLDEVAGSLLAAFREPDLHPRPRSRVVRALTWLTVPLGVLALLVVLDVGQFLDAGDAIVVVSAIVLGLAVALLGRRALLAWRITAGVGALWLVPGVFLPDSHFGWPWPVTVVLLVVAPLVMMRYRRAVGWGVGGWTVLLLLLAGHDGPGLGWALALIAVSAVIDARRQRSRAQEEARLEREARAVQEERSLVLEERTRLARDLHDVVAHHMSMVAVQAESAQYRLDGLDEAARAEFASIADSARAALSDVRGILSVLRDTSGAVERAPQPTLERVDELVATARTAGARVTLDVDGERRSLPAALEISAYRIIQESLANASRHAPGAPVRVALHFGVHELTVTVDNDRPPGGPARPVAGEGGHGLTGMRERAELLGGRLAAGPRADGGFRVEAQLPVPAARVPLEEVQR